MTQNIYDNPEFFAGYSRLRRSVEGLDGAPEWPALRAMLPDLHGPARARPRLRLRLVLPLGARDGRGARPGPRRVREHAGAREGRRPRTRRSPTRAPIWNGSSCPPASFDLAYSSLALHYIENLDGLLAQVHRALVPGGSLVFSVEHPIYTAPADPAGRRCRRSQDLAGRPLPGGGPALHRLAGQGRDQAAPDDRHLPQPAAAVGLHPDPRRGVGPDRGADRRAPEFADERQRPPFLLVAARR